MASLLLALNSILRCELRRWQRLGNGQWPYGRCEAKWKWKWPHTDFHKFVTCLFCFRHFFCCIEKLSMRANAAAHGKMFAKGHKVFAAVQKVRSKIQIDRFDFFIHTKRAESCSFIFIEVHAVNRFKLADGWRWGSAACYSFHISSIHSTPYATHNNKSREASKCTHAHATAPSIQFSCMKFCIAKKLRAICSTLWHEW